jgi:transcriptional regulator with XRE-family HTH domain
MTNLLLLRDRHELTQEGLAEAAGFEYKHYQKIESGRRPNLRLDTLERLAQAFGLEAHQLISTRLPKNTRLHSVAEKSGGTRRRRRPRKLPKPAE